MQKTEDIDGALKYIGKDLGNTDWILIDQDLINKFADNTFDMLTP